MLINTNQYRGTSVQLNVSLSLKVSGAQEFSEAPMAIHLVLEDVTVPFHWDSLRILHAIGIARWPMPNAAKARLNHFTCKVQIARYHSSILNDIHS